MDYDQGSGCSTDPVAVGDDVSAIGSIAAGGMEYDQGLPGCSTDAVAVGDDDMSAVGSLGDEHDIGMLKCRFAAPNPPFFTSGYLTFGHRSPGFSINVYDT